jgi:dTDP-glucose 4,6-dehydratase
MKKNILLTGGAGFIGSNLLRMMVDKYPNYKFVNLDKLTYAGNLENLTGLEDKPNYTFVKGDICDSNLLNSLFEKHKINAVMHLAAESHVDRSISNPMSFIETNIVGTVSLLNAAKHAWDGVYEDKIFYHISTDEVYGSLGDTGFFTETTSYDPRSPYSASKASSDHLVRAYYHTYGMPVKLSNCSNNYGPYQFPEKLLPLMINNIKNNKELPVYGDGKYTRDWLWVDDHSKAIDLVFHKGIVGETYNIGGNNEWKNIDLVELLCDTMDKLLGRQVGSSRSLIRFVKDRPGHDRRYAIDATKIKDELGWEPMVQMDKGLLETAQWYLDNEAWMDRILSGAYKEYYSNQYE